MEVDADADGEVTRAEFMRRLATDGGEAEADAGADAEEGGGATKNDQVYS